MGSGCEGWGYDEGVCVRRRRGGVRGEGRGEGDMIGRKGQAGRHTRGGGDSEKDMRSAVAYQVTRNGERKRRKKEGGRGGEDSGDKGKGGGGFSHRG